MAEIFVQEVATTEAVHYDRDEEITWKLYTASNCVFYIWIKNKTAKKLKDQR